MVPGWLRYLLGTIISDYRLQMIGKLGIWFQILDCRLRQVQRSHTSSSFHSTPIGGARFNSVWPCARVFHTPVPGSGLLR
jgi:hypothetical protein